MVGRHAASLLLVLAAIGCSDGTDGATSGTGGSSTGSGGGGAGDAGACGPGSASDGDVCIPAGLDPALPCPPGEVPLGDGSCQPAGVPPEGCADGFEHDGEDRCLPVLPAAPCPTGTMALAGETTCRPVTDCGRGTWGNVPVEADTVYVDGSAPGTGDGTATLPFATIAQGIAAAPMNAIVAVAAGTYSESVTIASSKPIRLWGRCPDMVQVGLAGETAALTVFGDGAEAHGLALAASGYGLAVSGASGVIAEGLWVHDTTDAGVVLFPGTDAILRGVLVENTVGTGIYASATTLAVEDSAVRATLPDPAAFAIVARTDSASRVGSTLTLTHSVVEQIAGIGVSNASSQASLDGVVIRDLLAVSGGAYAVYSHPSSLTPSILADTTVTRSWLGEVPVLAVYQVSGTLTVEDTVIAPSDASGEFGLVGVEATDGPMPELHVARSTIHGHTGCFGLEGHATVEALVARDCGIGEGGFAIQVGESKQSPTPGSLDLRYSVIEDAERVGMNVFGSTVQIESLHIDGVTLDPNDDGRCIQVRPGLTMGAPSVVEAEALLAEGCEELGVVVAGATATLRSSRLGSSGATMGLGLTLLPDLEVPQRTAQGTFERLAVEGTRGAGIAIFPGSATIVDSAVRGTASDAQGLFGDGISGVAYQTVPSVIVEHTLVSDSERAAIASFGTHLELGDSALTCQAFDLDAEPSGGFEADLVDLGGNACGCPDADGTCTAVSASLTPPEPPEL